ncbi:MAG TPA: M1 family aminopeptidase [Flavipsychrobacter sp.]|nr:M1 family aminopeptidase [Flavipsychrobacter sp.]
MQNKYNVIFVMYEGTRIKIHLKIVTTKISLTWDMNQKKLLYILLLLFISINVYAGDYTKEKHALAQRLAKTTLADIAENDYDVQYVKFNLNLTNISTTITGDVTTRARVTNSSLTKYVFELNNDLTIDSLKLNGVLSTVTTSGTVRSVVLSTPLSYGSVFNAEIFYHGEPASGTGLFGLGLVQANFPSGTQILYTLSDPYTASDWWPSKQSLTDKIDSADIWVTIPTGTEAGSNGLLQKVVTIDSSHIQYQWKTRYPIDYYLLSVAVAPYRDYSSYMHFTGSTDSMLIQNFFFDTTTFVPAYKANFDSVGMMVNYLSTLYGRYPFYKEKYGMCFSNLNGGMENQTMTTIGVTETPLIAHELGHQWFGDHVTYSSWGDIWLSEGFASYTEQLFVEHFWSKAAAYDYRTVRYNNVLSYTNGSVYVTDTNNTSRVFDIRLTYYKGAAVVHMLRFIAPNDSMFFQVLKNYQQQYAFGLANTDSLKKMAESVYGQNLDTFFNQWIYGQGYPTFSIKWNQKGSNVTLQLNQTASDPSVTKLFATPLEIQLSSSSGDTVVRVYNDEASQLYNFTWDKTIDSIAIDPNNWILNKVGTISEDTTLGVQQLKKNTIRVYPNPSNDNWQVDNLQNGSVIILTNVQGQIIWKERVNASSITIPCKDLANGSYFLQVDIDGSTLLRQLIRR